MACFAFLRGSTVPRHHATRARHGRRDFVQVVRAVSTFCFLEQQGTPSLVSPQASGGPSSVWHVSPPRWRKEDLVKSVTEKRAIPSPADVAVAEHPRIQLAASGALPAVRVP